MGVDLTVGEALRIFVAERDWSQFHTPANLAKSVAIEPASFSSVLQWSDEGPRDRIIEELADVLNHA